MVFSIPLFITIAVIVIFLLIFFHYVPFFLWINALSAGVRISLVNFLAAFCVGAASYNCICVIEAPKAGLKTLRDDLGLTICGGKLRMFACIVSASKANIDLTFQMATVLTLGRNVLEAVRMSVGKSD